MVMTLPPFVPIAENHGGMTAALFRLFNHAIKPLQTFGDAADVGSGLVLIANNLRNVRNEWLSGYCYRGLLDFYFGIGGGRGVIVRHGGMCCVGEEGLSGRRGFDEKQGDEPNPAIKQRLITFPAQQWAVGDERRFRCEGMQKREQFCRNARFSEILSK
jgi:hypothetical protein